MEDVWAPDCTPAARLAEAGELDRGGNALDMRHARLLAVIKRLDLAPLGYASFRAFCHAEVHVCDTRVRQLIRLVESPFAKVRRAVVEGRLAVSVAIRVVGLDPTQEDAWLEDAIGGRLPSPSSEPAVELTEADAATVHAARELARLNLGAQVRDDTADRHILGAWRARRSRDEILDEALASPPAPSPLPSWPGEDPADALVGPWVDPSDADHAVALLRLVDAMRQERVRQLGFVLDAIARKRDFETIGYATFAAWARQELSIDVRTIQRYRKALEEEPDLDLARALFVEDVTTDDTREAWREIVPHVPAAELVRVRILAGRGEEEALRAEYTRVVAEVERRATGDATKGAQRRFVSLYRTLPPLKPPRSTRAHPDLLEAARWYLERGRTPRRRGLGWVRERDHHTCANPECAVRTLRVQVHHIVPRSEGGTDDGWNLGLLCPGCHLRLRHSGHLGVTVEGDMLVFTFRDREIWMAGHPALTR